MCFYNLKKLNRYLEQDCNVVITGDSLAYNRYDFVDDPRRNAWECPVAMESWSFLLRDYLISHGRGFIPAKELEIEGKGISVEPFNKRVPLNERLPMSEHGVTIRTTEITDIKIKGCPKILYFVTEPEEESGFTSNGERFSLSGRKELFNGRYIKAYECSSDIRNLQADSKIHLIGASDVKTQVYLTGCGNVTAEWLLCSSEERILKFKPDLCFLIIGANNRRMKNPKSFRAAFKGIIERLINAESEVVVLTPPHSSRTDPEQDGKSIYLPDPDITLPIIEAIFEETIWCDLVTVDLFALFNGIPSSVWRYDNTHFTKRGNILLYKKLVDNIFGGE